MAMKNIGLTRVRTMTRVFHKLTRVGKGFLADRQASIMKNG